MDESRVPEFIEKLKASYAPYHGLHGDELSEIIFATKPSSGASGASLISPSVEVLTVVQISVPIMSYAM